MKINCPNCGNEITLTTSCDKFTCPICNTTSSLNKAETLYRYVMPFRISDEQAKNVFKTWATGPDKAIDLYSNAANLKWEKYYLPIAKIVRLVEKYGKVDEEVSIFSLCKGTAPHPELVSDTIPAGDMLFYEGEVLDGYCVGLDTDIGKVLNNFTGTKKEQSVIFVPAYYLTYTYNNNNYFIAIDGVTGKVSTSLYPQASDKIYKKCANKWLLPGIGGGVAAGLCSLIPTAGWIVAPLLFIATVVVITIMSKKDAVALLAELENAHSPKNLGGKK